jgi:hypothetical protein
MDGMNSAEAVRATVISATEYQTSRQSNDKQNNAQMEKLSSHTFNYIPEVPGVA